MMSLSEFFKLKSQICFQVILCGSFLLLGQVDSSAWGARFQAANSTAPLSSRPSRSKIRANLQTSRVLLKSRQNGKPSWSVRQGPASR